MALRNAGARHKIVGLCRGVGGCCGARAARAAKRRRCGCGTVPTSLETAPGSEGLVFIAALKQGSVFILGGIHSAFRVKCKRADVFSYYPPPSLASRRACGTVGCAGPVSRAHGRTAPPMGCSGIGSASGFRQPVPDPLHDPRRRGHATGRRHTDTLRTHKNHKYCVYCTRSGARSRTCSCMTVLLHRRRLDCGKLRELAGAQIRARESQQPHARTLRRSVLGARCC